MQERGVNDMKVKTVKSLLIIATVLSVGVSSVPVMAVDLSPDSDTGISVDADDSSSVVPSSGATELLLSEIPLTIAH